MMQFDAISGRAAPGRRDAEKEPALLPQTDQPDPQPAPQIAVIIPHYNDRDRLDRCLTALEPQDRTGVEVVVADNGTPGGLPGLMDRFPWVRVVLQPEKGAAAARNQGVSDTTAPWLVFLDADCVPAPGWMARAKQIATGDPGRVTGGRVDVFDETPAPRSGAEAFETVFAFDQAGYIRDKGFSVTANLVAARAVYDVTGAFIVGRSEDLDWCHRATAAGADLVYDADLAVSHPTRSDWPALARKWRRLTAEEYGLGRARLTWAAKALAMPFSVLAHAPRVLRHPDLTAGDRLRALGTLARLRMTRMVWMLGQTLGRAP